ncbi:MAG: BTAD domain-containing putative transcriptional regulator, partial [Stackebrandtia sp.]
MSLDVYVLGPIALRVRGREVDIGPARQRALFAILAAEANRPITTDQLEYRFWGDTPLKQARKTLHGYLTRLRRVLSEVDGVELVRHGGGYVLDVAAERVDLHRFRDLVARAQRDRTAQSWHNALDQWRGNAFGDLDIPWLNRLRRELHAERDLAELERNDAYLRQGRHRELLPELTDRVEQRPLDERLAGQYIEVLHHCGRSADALAHFRKVRDRLVEQQGQEPGRALREIHRGVLAGRLDAAQPPAVPRQLPADTAAFTGREQRLAEVCGMLISEAANRPAVIAVDGMGGAGKTTFVVRAATAVADRYPDGQLFVDLRGFSGGATPVDPAEALDGMLRSLGVPGDRVPTDLAGRSALLRTELSERRVLIVLDNAADETQVLPLLPGPSASVVLVTSRRRMTGVDDAATVTMEELSRWEAVELFTKIIGA